MENLHPNQTTIYDFLPKEKKSTSDKAKIISIKFLIERYKKEIEKLKENDSFKDDKKLQTVCILREVCQDLELILESKWKNVYSVVPLKI